MKTIKMLIGGRRVRGEDTLPVYHKETGEQIAEIAAAGEKQVRAAVDAAERAFREVRLSPYERYEIIMRAANLMHERREEFAMTLSAEAGKPIRDARGEIDRAYQTLILSAEEAKRLRGETVPLAGAPGCAGRVAFTIRRPLGIVCAITPFNFPVNLAAHKIGPMISEREAQRIEEWVDEAEDEGARVLAGGNRTGAFYEPTVLTDVTTAMKVVSEETFAPVFSIIPYDTIEEAVAAVNDTRYGLQAGVFTRSLAVANYCAEHLEVGGVIIGDGATFRMDNMPYGGVKESGIGREGPAYAIRELTEEKLIVLNVEG